MQECINRRNSDFKKTNSTFFINDDVSTTVAFFTSDVAHSQKNLIQLLHLHENSYVVQENIDLLSDYIICINSTI